MLKKLVLLILGGAGAAAGFTYFTEMPADQAKVLANSLWQQKVNLESVAKDIASSEVMKKVVDKSKAALAENPGVQDWLNQQVRDYAQQQQIELGADEARAMVDAVMELQQFSGAEALGASGEPEISQEGREQIAAVMARGNAVFNEHLGVSMGQFLKNLESVCNASNHQTGLMTTEVTHVSVLPG